MWRLIKLLFWIALLAAIMLVGYAYLGPILLPDHFEPPVSTVTAPVEIEID